MSTKRIAGLMARLVVVGATSAVWGGTISYLPITNDADSGISASNVYVHALDFGTHDNGALVNGVQFTRGDISTVGLPGGVTYTVSSGGRNQHGGDGNANVSGGVTNLFYDMIYNSSCAPGGTATLSLSRLVPGAQYDARIYTRQWGASAGTARLVTIGFDTNNDLVAEDSTPQINEDDATSVGFASFDQAYALSYQFTATSDRLNIIFTQANNNNSWHVYGSSLQQTGAPAATLANASFEADTFPTYPGYISNSNNGMITGWVASHNAQVGLNPTGGGSPFANNGVIPDGTQVAFIQAGNVGPRSLTQRVYGLGAGETYVVAYRENVRSGYQNPTMQVTLGAQTIVPSHVATAVGGSNPYKYVGSQVFTTPADGAYDLTFHNLTTSGDATALIDKVQLLPIHLAFSDNFNVKSNSNTVNPGANDQPHRQDGLFAPLNYTERGGTPVNFTQLGHAHDPSALLLVTNSGFSTTSVSPNHNFKDNLGADGAHYVLQFQVNPANTATAGTLDASWWSAVVFGASSQTASVNTSDGVGMLIRRNGGYQIFDGTSGNGVVKQGDLGTDFGITEGGYYDVRINYFVPAFDDASRVGVAIFVDENLISSFWTGSGFANNYIDLVGHGPISGGGAYVYHDFDNFSLYTTAVPEPATMALLSLATAGLGGYVRRRRG